MNTAKSKGIEQTTYDTLKHTQSEISAVLPNTTHFAPIDPPTYLGPWIDVIASSRGIDPVSIHPITLSPTYSDAEDFELLFTKKTTNGVPTVDLFDAPSSAYPRQYFLRFDVCSLKDGFQRTLPVATAKDIYTRIATSPREMKGIRELLATDPPTPITL
ncbi:MAG: hypothetical protein M1835_001309 [Candelina submexicana]|nr:MAG: hypothetical protein M1835_001309 [Candelina submexicana]